MRTSWLPPPLPRTVPIRPGCTADTDSRYVPVSSPDLLAVDEPFDLESRVVDRLQPTLEVGVLALLKVLQAAEAGRGGGGYRSVLGAPRRNWHGV